MKRTLRTILTVLLVIVLMVSLVHWVQQEQEYRLAKEEYSSAAIFSGLPVYPETEGTFPTQTTADTYAMLLSEMDISALRDINSDVVGWLVIPNTAISYPLLQTQDNDYYLSHTWKKNESSVGAIFLDSTASTQFDDFNTLIYGHRMRDGSMFGGLRHYQTSGYWSEHPSIYLVTETFVRRYDIYAAYEPAVSAVTFTRATTTEQKEEFIRFGLAQSVFPTELSPTANDTLLTLTTCTGWGYDHRWVVQAMAVDEIPRTTTS